MADTPPDYSPDSPTPLAPSPRTAGVPGTLSAGSPGPGAAPTTPEWLLGRDMLLPGPTHLPTCPVCQCTVCWPGCAHQLHLGCVAHVAANLALLRCRSCRAAWPPPAATTLHEACRAQAVGMPAPAPEHDTTSAAHHAATAPPPPRQFVPLCCPHVHFLLAQATPKMMQLGNREAALWRPEWVCLRCNIVLDESHALLQDVPSERPICPTHGPRALAIDMREGSRGWVCCAASPPQLLPCMPVSATPEPGPQTAHGSSHTSSACCLGSSRDRHCHPGFLCPCCMRLPAASLHRPNGPGKRMPGSLACGNGM